MDHIKPIWDEINRLRVQATDAAWEGRIHESDRLEDEADKLEKEARNGQQYAVDF